MTSPYSSGGGGTHFEARVAATYLAAVLCGAPARGLIAETATEVRTQKAGHDEPLDDIVVLGTSADGNIAKLSLQVKSEIIFTAKDPEWIAVLHAAWDTFANRDFDTRRHRIGTAIANYNAKIDKYYQSVLNWATQSANADDFFGRITKKDFSHAEKRDFVDTIRTILETHITRPIESEELWNFLRVFVILHFDLNLQDRSRDAAAVIDRIRDLLKESTPQQAPAVWAYLIQEAGNLIPAGGSAARANLTSALVAAGLPAGTPTSYRSDLKILNRESDLALAQIRDDIAGLSLFRAIPYERLRNALNEARFIQIDGEPGAGKSALLKSLALECARSGPIFVLKDRRIHPRGWSAHAHVLGICNDPAIMLREFGCCGEPILFIDGVDKIDDPAEQVTVNDLVRTIAESEYLGRWRVVVTVRGQNLRHIETWLDVTALKKLGLATVTVGGIVKDETAVIASAHPRLAPLLRQSAPLDVILSRPFFIEALLSLSERSPAAELPASEVELLQLWWRLGGADRAEFSASQHRRNALMALAKQLVAAPSAPLNITSLPPELIDELKTAGVLRDKDFGHSVIFAHDIYEEWTLCQYLLTRQSTIGAELRESGEPHTLVRPLQLLGTYLLESQPSSLQWEALLGASSNNDLRPVWQRAVLTAPLQSTQAPALLERLESFLLADNAEYLKRLLTATRTVEVVPNELYLNERLTPHLDPAERVKMAEYWAVPKIAPWLRMLNWLVPKLVSLPAELIPELPPFLSTWQSAWGGRNARYCREIGAEAYRWLLEFEDARYVDDWKDKREPYGVHFGYDEGDKLEKSIRGLFLVSAGDVPELAKEYLADLSKNERRERSLRKEVLNNCLELVRRCPKELVDFIIDSYLEPIEEDNDPFGGKYRHIEQDLGITDDHDFYPASPLQAPFLVLLKTHEEEGLRLVRSICNHSIAAWRWSRSHPYHYARATPISVTIKFPWGGQTFWGDSQVYMWFRAFWGSHASRSALMALEQWALERLEAGEELSSLFRKCVEGHEGNAALGLAVSLCLAHGPKAVETVFPLVTCPHIWQWDVARRVQDHRGLLPNEMGDWHHYRHLLQGVRDLNGKVKRDRDVRDFIPYFVLNPDRRLVRHYTKRIRKFVNELPFEYEEQKKNKRVVNDLRQTMQSFVEQADPKYWKQRPSADGKHIEIYNDPPSLNRPEAQAKQEEYLLLNKVTNLALWGQKTLENGAVDARLTLADAYRIARELESTDLFEINLGSTDFLNTQRASAVAAVAYVLARHSSADEWTDAAGWCLDVLERMATIIEGGRDFAFRGSATLMHPTVFAVHGYSALLARGVEVRRAQDALISLAVDALDDVVKAVFAASRIYAAAYPEFFQILLVLGMKQCVSAYADLPDYNSVHWDEFEAGEKSELISWAEDALDRGDVPAFPQIPPPWVKVEKARLRRGKPIDYVRGEVLFRYDLAEKTLLEIELSAILDGRARNEFLAMIGELIDWTIQQLVPPWSDGRTRDRDTTPPFEWIFAFSAWCGKLGARLKRRFLFCNTSSA
jgi:hypothetical protein